MLVCVLTALTVLSCRALSSPPVHSPQPPVGTGRASSAGLCPELQSQLCVDIQEGHREDSGTALGPEALLGRQAQRICAQSPLLTSFPPPLGSPGPWLFCPRTPTCMREYSLRRAAAGLLHELGSRSRSVARGEPGRPAAPPARDTGSPPRRLPRARLMKSWQDCREMTGRARGSSTTSLYGWDRLLPPHHPLRAQGRPWITADSAFWREHCYCLRISMLTEMATLRGSFFFKYSHYINKTFIFSKRQNIQRGTKNILK